MYPSTAEDRISSFNALTTSMRSTARSQTVSIHLEHHLADTPALAPTSTIRTVQIYRYERIASQKPIRNSQMSFEHLR